MKTNRLITAALLVCGIVLFLVNSCRKIDHLSEEVVKKKNEVREKFLTIPASTHPIVKAIAQSIERQDRVRDFIPRLATRAGFPQWSYAKVVSKASSGSRTAENNPSAESSMAFIPFVRDSSGTTDALLIVKVNQADTLYRLVYPTRYRDLRMDASGAGRWGAKDVFHAFLYFDNALFGTTSFDVYDKALMKDTSGSFTRARMEIRKSAQSSASGSRGAFMESVCFDVSSCTICQSARTGNENNLSTNSLKAGCCPYEEYTFCIYFWVDSFEDADWSWYYAGGGGGSGTIPCADGCTWENTTPCNPNATPLPENPGSPVAIPVTDLGCPAGWVPVYPLGLDNREPLDTTVYSVDAAWQGISTYITSGGTPITLPPGAKIQAYRNIDPAIFPNGALYGFSINGSRYASMQKAYLTPGAAVVPGPEFRGYYKVEDLQVKFDSAFNPSLLAANPAPVNGMIKAIRVRWDKDSTGQCKLVREVVDYTPRPELPATVDIPTKADYDIEYLPLSQGYPSEATNSQCPGSSNAAPLRRWQMTLEKYFNEKGADLSSFLHNRLHSKVKIYLYDCATGQVKYTIGSEGNFSIPPAQQQAEMDKFNSGNFTSADADIAIAGCLENGQWKYDVKLNNASLGTPHPKVAPHLGEVLAEIKKQADEEVASVKNGGRKKETEYYPVGNGEKFYKASMDLMELVSSIWDVGRHIVKEGQMPESIWDQGRRSSNTDPAIHAEYEKSVFKMPSSLAGGVDQVVDEALGIVQLTQAGIQFIRHPGRTLDGVWKGVRSLDAFKLRKILSSASGYDNYTAGGDRSTYQLGRHGVQTAMIVFNSVKALTKGTEAIKEAGEEITELQKFIPDRGINNPAADALKNATENNKLVKNLDNEKLLTKNVVNGEEHVVVLDKAGEVYSSKVTHNIDGVGDNVLKEASPDDIVDMHIDPGINTQVKTQPQQFIDGKKFERNINADPTHTGKVQTESGIDLTGFSKANQVQIKLSNGNYTVADNVWWKRTDINGQPKYEIVVNESKISSTAPFSNNQIEFKNQVINGNTTFILRSNKFALEGFPQNAQLEVKAYINTVGNGTTDISNYIVTKIK